MQYEASSQERWRASASERRRYGGSTVTKFFVSRDGFNDSPSEWLTVIGYGRMPGNRKTNAIAKAIAIWEKQDAANV
jgi:hypothetical protein